MSMSRNAKELPVPAFFNPKNAASWNYQPNVMEVFAAAQEWRGRYGVAPAAGDSQRIIVLGIDLQRDFCFPEGTLYVAGRSGTGAIDDNVRIAGWVYRNLNRITDFIPTFDTHFPQQCFFPWFWIDQDGRPLEPHTLVIAENGRLNNVDVAGNVLKRDVRPNPAITKWVAGGNSYVWLCEQMQFYSEELDRGGKYQLYLWPPHCLLGSDGHVLAGVIQEARLFHTFARSGAGIAEVKGGHPLTENYSVMRGEVLARADGKGQLAQINARLFEKLAAADALVICGQAASHCTKSTIEDLLDMMLRQDPELLRKVRIMKDGMSSVVVPDGKGGFAADFTPQAEAALAKFEDAGMTLITSDQDVNEWI